MERLDAYVSRISAASFARYGFGHGELIQRWPEVIGQALARHCEPVRIRWPAGTAKASSKLGGTLHVRAEPGFGLDVQHQAPQIIERIGQFLGHGAITTIHIRQERLKTVKPLSDKDKNLSQGELEKLGSLLRPISDPGLKDALHKLGSGLLKAKPQPPPGQ